MTDQMEFPLARNSDPDTSHKAAVRLSAYTMRAKLLDAFKVADMTAEEAAERCNYSAASGAWKRVSDLKNAGLIIDTGVRRKGRSGREQIVWSCPRS